MWWANYIYILTNLLSDRVYAQHTEFPYAETSSTVWATTNFGSILKTEVINPDKGVMRQILRLFGMDQYANVAANKYGAIAYAVSLINLALSLVAMIAFIMLLYSFGMILFSNDDASIDNARKMVKNITFAIAIIAVSRLLVTMVYSIYTGIIG